MSEKDNKFKGLEFECGECLRAMGCENWGQEQKDAMSSAFYSGALLVQLSINQIIKENEDKSGPILNDLFADTKILIQKGIDKMYAWEEWHKANELDKLND